MKGKILDYNIQESKGVISGDDGQRYNFENKDWKGSELPKVNQVVNFEIDEYGAKDIYLLENQDKDIDSLKVNHNEVKKGAIFAAIGSGIMILSLIPILEAIIFVGAIFELIGVKKLSNNAQIDKKIFKNMLYSYIFLAFSLIFIFVAIIIVSIPSSPNNIGFETNTLTTEKIVGIIVGGTISIIFIILSIIKMYKSINSIAKEYKNSLMQMSAKLYIASFVMIAMLIIVFFILGAFSMITIEEALLAIGSSPIYLFFMLIVTYAYIISKTIAYIQIRNKINT